MVALRIMVNDQVLQQQRCLTLIDLVKNEFIRAGYNIYSQIELNQFTIGWKNKFLGIIPLGYINETYIAKVCLDEANRRIGLEVYGRKHIDNLKNKLEKIALKLDIKEALLNLVEENPIEHNCNFGYFQ